MAWLILIYALLIAAGGVAGYVKAGSTASLTSGLISGAALGFAWYLSLQNPKSGLILATVLALALLIVFALRFKKTQALMPAGLMAILSLVMAVIFAIGAFS